MCKLATDGIEMVSVSCQIRQKSGSHPQSLRSVRPVRPVRPVRSVRSVRSAPVKKQTGKHCGSTPPMERFSPKTIALVPASNKSDH